MFTARSERWDVCSSLSVPEPHFPHASIWRTSCPLGFWGLVCMLLYIAGNNFWGTEILGQPDIQRVKVVRKNNEVQMRKWLASHKNFWKWPYNINKKLFDLSEGLIGILTFNPHNNPAIWVLLFSPCCCWKLKTRTFKTSQCLSGSHD